MILQYNPAISTMAAITVVDQSTNEAFDDHLFTCPYTQALSFTFKPYNLFMPRINGKNQETAMIPWNRKA